MTDGLESSDSPRLGGIAARRAAMFTILFQGLSKVTALVVVVLLVRILSEEDYGVYNVYFSIIAFIGTVFSLGISSSLTRFLPEYHKNYHDRLAHSLYRYGSIARFASNFVVLMIMWLFWDRISEFLQIGESKDVFTIFALIVLTHFQASILSTTLSAYLLQKQAFGGHFLFALAKLLGYGFLLGTSRITLTWVLIIDLIAYLILYAWQKNAYRRFAPRPVNKDPVDVSVERKRVLRFAFFYNFSDLGQFSVGSKIDYLFLAAMADPIMVGAYALGRKLEKVSTTFLPVKFFLGIIRPLFFTLDVEKEPTRVNAYFQLLTKLTYMCLLPLAVFMITAYEPLTNAMMAGKFNEHKALIAAIFGFALLAAFQKPLMLVVQLSERAGVVLLSKLFGIVNLVALFLLIPVWGVIGAAVATGVTVICSRLFLWWSVRHIIRIRGFGTFATYSVLFWASVLVLVEMGVDRIHNPLLALIFCLLFTGLACLPYVRGPILNVADKLLLRDVLNPREMDILIRVGILNRQSIDPGTDS